MSLKFTVYRHINKINGKSYIGWCQTTIEERWSDHCADARGKRSRTYFHNALRHWGTSNDVWEHVVLERMSTLDGAKRAEQLWIAQLKTFAYDLDGWGYNETRGGDGTVGFRHSDATRRFLSEINTGANHPQFGKVGANAGRTFLPETRLKMSLAHLGQKRSDEFRRTISERQMISVQKFALDGSLLCEYASMKIACKNERMSLHTLRKYADSKKIDKKRKCVWKVAGKRHEF